MFVSLMASWSHCGRHGTIYLEILTMQENKTPIYSVEKYAVDTTSNWYTDGGISILNQWY